MKMTDRYELNKETKVGGNCVCPSCKTTFVKETYQQVFCKTKGGTICKDKYWNKVDPKKRNNTTRLTNKRKKWLDGRLRHEFDPLNHIHPFSSEALGDNDC